MSRLLRKKRDKIVSRSYRKVLRTNNSFTKKTMIVRNKLTRLPYFLGTTFEKSYLNQ